MEAQRRLEGDAELIDLVRAERSRVTWLERLRAQQGVVAVVVGAVRHQGHVVDVGADWLLMRPVSPTAISGGASWVVSGSFQAPARGPCTGAGEVLIPTAAVQAVGGLLPGVAPLSGVVARSLGLGSVLRGLARDRSVVTVALGDGTALTGTPSAVGADHFDLRCHEPDEPSGRGPSWTLPFTAVSSLRLR